MKAKLTTVLPVYNGAAFILETLESVARQSRRPDRIVVLDNCSTDNTEELVRGFKGLSCEWHRNPQNLGLFGNSNRALEFAEETDYLQLLHADDMIEPRFYEVMTETLEDCQGIGMAFCLDERIDENGQHLTVSGKADGAIKVVPKDAFLREKADIGNQAFCASILKTNYQKAPCLFRMDMPMMADMMFWADWGAFCQKIVKVNLPLAKYRWHGTNTTNTSALAPDVRAMVLDEWRTMELVEKLRGPATPASRWFFLKLMFGVRSGIKAKRFRQMGNPEHSKKIINVAKPVTGTGIWGLAKMIIESRDLFVYGLLRRKRHPKNIYT